MGDQQPVIGVSHLTNFTASAGPGFSRPDSDSVSVTDAAHRRQTMVPQTTHCFTAAAMIHIAITNKHEDIDEKQMIFYYNY